MTAGLPWVAYHAVMLQPSCWHRPAIKFLFWVHMLCDAAAIFDMTLWVNMRVYFFYFC